MSFVLRPPGNFPTIDKYPDASLVYGLDVADIIAAGDTLATVDAEANGVTAGAASANGTVISSRVSGGSAGTTASVTFSWTTAGGDADGRTLYFRVAQR